MAINKPHLFEPGIYFLTFTNYNWISLFDITNSYDLVYKWFDVLNSNGHSILGYVIMPNHIHVLIGFKPGRQSINTTVGNGKRFMAYTIVERLKQSNKTELLALLEEGVTASDKRKGKLHEVFQPSFEIKQCRTLKFINQKLNYIHANPVSKKWSLVQDAIDYAHSTLSFYETGVQGVYGVLHFADWLEDVYVSEYKLRMPETD